MATGLTVSLFSAAFLWNSLLLGVAMSNLATDQVGKLTISVITTAHKHILQLIYSVFAKDFECSKVGGVM